jgi:hypothetical protein
MKPTVVIVAYNRPDALTRLLDSLLRADIPSDTSLVISIDGGGSHAAQMRSVASSLAWPHGDKQIALHDRNLGMVAHSDYCGGLSEKYGSIVRLEEDNLVSAAFYRYASQALNFYASDSRIAGVSLYGLWFHGYSAYPFVPYLDDSDAFFAQVAWSHGQAYTQAQWQAFRQWREAAPHRPIQSDLIHDVYTTFDQAEWFHIGTQYLAETGRYYVFTRESHVTNSGDAGTHFARSTHYFQVPLQHFRRDFHFQPLDASHAIYDSFMEMQPGCLSGLTDRLNGYEFELDLYAQKSLAKIRASYVLTTQRSHKPVMTFGLAMWPPEENVVTGVTGAEIALTRAQDLDTRWFARLLTLGNLYRYFTRGRQIGRRTRLKLWLANWLARVGWDTRDHDHQP